MKLHHKIAIIGLSSTTLGIAGLVPFALSASEAAQTQAVTTNISSDVALDPQPAPKAATIAGKPVRLVVPAANIDIAVGDGAYNTSTGEWTLTKTKAFYALPTAQANNAEGNTLIYGHDIAAVFRRLHKLPAGAEAQVFTDNGHVFTYKLRHIEVVDPSNTTILDYAGKPQLTLQTCTGVWSEARKLFYFDLINAK